MIRLVLVTHLLHVLICTGAILFDRARLSKSPDRYGAQRMWHPATLWLVGCGLFLPPILGWYAHLTITRRGSFVRRHGIALLLTAAAAVALEVSATAVFAIFGWQMPGEPLTARARSRGGRRNSVMGALLRHFALPFD